MRNVRHRRSFLRASVCRQIFTHFIREEDPGMVSGRLDEELQRISTIADQISPHCLILFNESFAATNEREGSEIGRQVVRALLEADIRVFFVSHQFDFSDSFRRLPEITLFLRAPRQPGGQRTYKLIVAEPLPTSYAQDIYYRIGGWLAERHGDATGVPGRPARPGISRRGPQRRQLTRAARFALRAAERGRAGTAARRVARAGRLVQAGDDGQDGDQRDQHVSQIGIQAAGLQPLR